MSPVDAMGCVEHRPRRTRCESVACSRRMRGTPPAEVDVDEALVRGLLLAQAPDFATFPLHDPRNGWDNRTWRLGDALAVRLPRREAAAQLLLHEQRWLVGIAARLPLPAPAPVVVGRPTAHFPWAWSVVPWYPGDVAAHTPPEPDEARTLGRFLAALHVPAEAEAPENPYRGVPLAARLPWVKRWLATEHQPDDADLVARAAALVIATAGEQPPSPTRVWLHGDLHPRNILVRDGRLAAILDWGDLCGGDPATDLATVWWLFDIEHHDMFWAHYGDARDGDQGAMWHRARAWAAIFGLMFLHFATADNPERADAEAADLARAMLSRVLGEQRPPVW
jgi:aminoglycoside phosphotransferase (APT) family kinase protein